MPDDEKAMSRDCAALRTGKCVPVITVATALSLDETCSFARATGPHDRPDSSCPGCKAIEAYAKEAVRVRDDEWRTAWTGNAKFGPKGPHEVRAFLDAIDRHPRKVP